MKRKLAQIRSARVLRGGISKSQVLPLATDGSSVHNAWATRHSALLNTPSASHVGLKSCVQSSGGVMRPLCEEEEEEGDTSAARERKAQVAPPRVGKPRWTHMLSFEKTRCESMEEWTESATDSLPEKPPLRGSESQRFSRQGGLESAGNNNRHHNTTTNNNSNDNMNDDSNDNSSDLKWKQFGSLGELRCGLQEAMSRHNAGRSRFASRSVLLTRSHALLQQVQQSQEKRNSWRADKSMLALASFYLFDFLLSPRSRLLLLWAAWLLSGTVFFRYSLGVSWLRGFYESVNAGYGVFLTSPSLTAASHSFLLLHLTAGTLTVSGYLTLLASFLNYTHHRRQLAALSLTSRQQSCTGADASFCTRARGFLADNAIHVSFVSILLACTLWGCLALQWPLLDSFYFTISLLSTCGQVSLPDTASDADYFLVALFASVGVPLMAVSFGLWTHSLTRIGELRRLREAISSGVSSAELKLLQSSGIEDEDGYVELSEFALLMLLRINSLHPDFIKLAKYRFMHLKEPGCSVVPIDKIGCRRESLNAVSSID